MANLFDLKQLKCKTCGEALDLSKANDGVVKCGFCDSCLTLPKSDAEQKVLDFLNQGEHDLDTGKFDEAYTAYSKAAELDKTEPEAYWGMALAEYKIQYLKDEVNNRLQPICHEINDKDFTDSANYLRAMKYATSAQREEYERKGNEIEYIKNEFYKIAQSGVKYDCFICVKVTDDETKQRTTEYKTADDIYFELKGKGYKPFFSERELGGVTGADYEARILYALYSCECMLVVCFDEAYLRTKWVKNEYTRFLKLVNDEEKESDSIALVFGNRPIEKLPNRHGKIQGIDIKSLTAMEHIVSFVDNHTPEAKKRREEAAATVALPSGSIENLLKRAFMCAEDGDFKKANNYAEEALDINPECAEAYLVKLMCDLKVDSRYRLGWKTKSFEKNSNYIKTVKFADEELKAELERALARTKENQIDKKEEILNIITYCFIIFGTATVILLHRFWDTNGRIDVIDYIIAIIGCSTICISFILFLSTKRYDDWTGKVERYGYSESIIYFGILSIFELIGAIVAIAVKNRDAAFLFIWMSACLILWGILFICGSLKKREAKSKIIILLCENAVAIVSLILSICCLAL